MTHLAPGLLGFLLLLVLFFGATTVTCYGRCHGDPDHARDTLVRQGYTDVEMTGAAPFSCSKDDWSRDGFRAKGPTGVPVEGAVCCGFWGKGCTVRTY